MKRFALIPVLLLSLTALTNHTYAQNEFGELDDPREELRWYEVEVLVFSQNQDPNTASELWRTDIKLSYPTNWVELIGMPQEPTPELAADLQDPSQQDPAETEIATQAAAQPIFDPLRDIAFHVLPVDELKLNDQGKRLQRRNHKILFHQAWRQRFVRNNPEPPSILIRGGEKFGDHYELEGSISLSYRRWLHVETNLWRTWFARNHGQETPNWPSLPPQPNQVNSIFASNMGAIDGDQRPFNSGIAGSNNLRGTNAPSSNNRINWSNDSSWQFQPLTSQYDNILSQPFVAEHMVLMRENRKVNRSDEVHYLDHPQLGMLVRFTRYDPPQPPRPAANMQQQINQALGITN